jgi:hypothetical protein
MPAKSEAQQHLMGMALAVKRGEKRLRDLPEDVRGKVSSVLRSMSEKTLREFASTSTKRLPARKGRPRKVRNVRSA